MNVDLQFAITLDVLELEVICTLQINLALVRPIHAIEDPVYNLIVFHNIYIGRLSVGINVFFGTCGVVAREQCGEAQGDLWRKRRKNRQCLYHVLTAAFFPIAGNEASDMAFMSKIVSLDRL
jgi:hypothetical protein